MGYGFAAMKRAARYVENQTYLEQQLPLILGTWYYVVPGLGDNNRVGTRLSLAVADVQTAYGKCVSGRGDGICVVSYGTASADTTSYLAAVLDWTKHNITVVGIAAGGFMGRARIAAPATADLAYLIDVQGQNNRFYNIHMANYGDVNTALGCLKVSGDRNYFEDCHFAGGGHATPAAVALNPGSNLGCHDLNLAASECMFTNCIFGNNSIIRAAANAGIVLSVAQSKNTFKGCRIMAQSATAGHGAIGLYATNVLNGWIVFEDCIFTDWAELAVESHTSVVIGSEPVNCGILLHNCGMIGWALWDSVTGNDTVYITTGAGHATGGLGIVAS